VPSTPVNGFSVDTRQVRPGEMFVAIKTDKRDGHAFLRAAQQAGARAALVAAADRTLELPQLVVRDPLRALQAIAREHRREFRGPVAGISGSAGKTSTKDLLALLLGGEACGVLATEGNLNNHLGVPLTLTRLDPARHRFAVIEAGISTPGEMQPLAEMIAPDVALITLVAAAHTEELGGIEGVAREKAVLPAATRPGGVAIFSREAAEFAAFRALSMRKLVVERVAAIPATVAPAEQVCFTVEQRADRTVLTIADGAAAPLTLTLRRVSDGMAQNAALAVTAARWLGAPREEIQPRLATWAPAKLRGEIRHADGRLLYLDCYNANPASMSDALATFAAIAPPDEPRLYLLGCMEELGPEAAAHHRALGRAVALRSEDRLFAIGQWANEICAGVLERGDFTPQIQIISSLEPAAAAIAEWRGSIFVKGSRRYQLERALDGIAAAVAH
jgi:UDP-N-acetylmuramoyl-tripeptide--D-alanyl-D-alanine ligase